MELYTIYVIIYYLWNYIQYMELSITFGIIFNLCNYLLSLKLYTIYGVIYYLWNYI
jgi:hypothetical protein